MWAGRVERTALPCAGPTALPRPTLQPRRRRSPPRCLCPHLTTSVTHGATLTDAPPPPFPSPARLQDDVADFGRQVAHKQAVVLSRGRRLAHAVGRPVQPEHLLV